MSTPSQPEASSSLSPRRRRFFRVGAVLFGLTLVLGLEVSLRILDLGQLNDLGDPYVGFSNVVPLFQLDEDTNRYQIDKARLSWFRPDSFQASKADNEFRIFCFGGSTVQGRPYAIETSFTTWLELNLKAAAPETHWQVVNCGGVSYASYRLVPIVEEVLGHEPDLLIVYTGHNEFLEERTYHEIKQRPAWVMALHERLIRSRIYALAHQWVHAPSPRRDQTTLAADVDALLDYQGGLAQYHRDDAFRDGVIHHFEANLRRMVHLARQASTPLIFINPVSNLRDSPPFKVELAPELGESERSELNAIWEQAKTSSWDDLSEKTRLVNAVLAIDHGHANAHFLLARIHEAQGDMTAAKEEYLRAKDSDVCPLRMLEEMHRRLAQVANQTGTPLIDIRQRFDERAEFGIPGDDELVDHVHPDIPGHQLIARQIFERLVEQGVVQPQENWLDEQKKLYRSNFESLPANYFPESQARLEGLRRWTQGRVTSLRLEKKDEPKAPEQE